MASQLILTPPPLWRVLLFLNLQMSMPRQEVNSRTSQSLSRHKQLPAAQPLCAPRKCDFGWSEDYRGSLRVPELWQGGGFGGDALKWVWSWGRGAQSELSTSWQSWQRHRVHTTRCKLSCSFASCIMQMRNSSQNYYNPKHILFRTQIKKKKKQN